MSLSTQTLRSRWLLPLLCFWVKRVGLAGAGAQRSVRSMSTSLATLVPNEDEHLEDEIARTKAELEAVSNKLQRLIQLRQLSEATEAATEALDKLASRAAAQKQSH